MTLPVRLALPLLAAALLVGCSTKRTLTIQSTPPGARVWVNGEARGVTPVAVPFTHYGTFEVRLEKNGYEAHAEEVRVPTRIDGYPVIDLPFELLVRRRNFTWQRTLVPLSTPSDRAMEELLRDAEAFRERTLREARPGAPPPPPPPPRTSAR
jgi:hypothetical protein